VAGAVTGWILSRYVHAKVWKALLPAIGVVVGFLAGLAGLARVLSEEGGGRG